MADNTKFLLLFLLLSSSPLCFGTEQDIWCLMSIQGSLADPGGVLRSWNFENETNGYICRFTGVECWHLEENKILSLRLGNLGLQGQFPVALQNCSSLTGLDLSNNNFSGPIPQDISQHNQLSGQIPPQFTLLTRLTAFNVADNLLSGPIPSLLQNYSASNFAGNQGLCGSPLDDCPPSRRRWRPVKIKLHRLNDQSSIGVAVGFVVGFVVAFYFPHCFVCSERLRAYVVRI
ncbi:probably inactive leucine-rich repeat receptor-like protein kinase At5g48380 isoform X2 [Triticum dicoccoides]|uniref:probably inactive leucine-rich repeat receptor-like protein kinase At5g48380 isoform X2 n=1 Tax=Triticum dicoccoides TaxID=85692 RepID=UPI00188F8971|nr:probably inactive leucine-rich repeat receptor-like protein kinase At5g48380 isoform X2 [Triticum dicoccoides]